MKGYSVDLQTDLVKEQFATIYAPRKQRNRFPENCVSIVLSEAEALAQEDKSKHILAAKVLGPARSSEGINLYYLVHWLVSSET
jgi:hypothetical protein